MMEYNENYRYNTFCCGFIFVLLLRFHRVFVFKDDGSIILRKFWFCLEIIYYFENT